MQRGTDERVWVYINQEGLIRLPKVRFGDFSHVVLQCSDRRQSAKSGCISKFIRFSERDARIIDQIHQTIGGGQNGGQVLDEKARAL